MTTITIKPNGKQRRYTIQRKLVLEAIQSMEGKHPTAAEIQTEIQKKYPEISTATVYNQLRKLSEEGMIRELSGVGSADRFDGIVKNHYHVLCQVCGEIKDLYIELPVDMNELASEALGCSISSHSLIFSGTCKSCAQCNE